MLAQFSQKEGIFMFNVNLATPYSLACALVPCAVYLCLHRRTGTLAPRLWAFVFCVYLWQVYELTGAGGLSDIFLQLRIFRDLGIHDLASLMAALSDPNGATVFRSTLNLVPLTQLSTNFLLNIAMTVPLGFLLPFIWRSWRRPLATILTGAGFSLLIECSQLLTSRACDIDDLIANTLGAALGYGCWWFLAQLACTHQSIGARLRGASDHPHEALTLIVLSFAGMFFLYHPFWFYNLIGA